MTKKFYTNYAQIGEFLHIKGYEDGKPFNEKWPIEPTYYITDHSKSHPWRSIYGECLQPVHLKSAQKAKELLETYKGTNVSVCGNINHGNQFMIENPSLSEYNIEDISVTFFDIEVQSRLVSDSRRNIKGEEFSNHRKKKIRCRRKDNPSEELQVSLLVFECYENVNDHYEVFDPVEKEWVDYWDSIYTEQGGFPDAHDADHQVVSIAMHESKSDKYYVLAFGPNKWSKEKSSLEPEVLEKTRYFHCKDESDLINKWLALMTKLNTDVLSGWHSGPFDVVYMYQRMKKLGIDPKRMSPWNRAYIREFKDDWGNTSYAVSISGVSNVDYKELFAKQAPAQPSYKLDNIAELVLGKKKVEYEGSLFDLYDQDFIKFIDYNITDVSLLVEMEKVKRYFDAIYGVAYRTKSTYDDTFGTIKCWENLVAEGMWKDKVVPPSYRPESKDGESIIGGYVKDPIPAAYGWVLSFDYASLYPNIMQMYNISPEKLRPHYGQLPCNADSLLDKTFEVSKYIQPDETVCASGYVFSTDGEGIFPKNMRELYQERKAMKKKQFVAEHIEVDAKAALKLLKNGETVEGEYAGKTEAELDEIIKKAVFDKMFFNTQQMTMKILLNSGYGALAQKSFLYFDNRVASSVTWSGQLGIREAEKTLNIFMNKALGTEGRDFVIAIDTDSCYLDVDELVNKFCDPENSTKDEITSKLDVLAKKKIEPALKKALDHLKDYQQARVQGLDMDREVISSRAVWRKKKNYCMLVHDNEGVRYDEPKIKIMGLEAVKSSTAKLPRKAMNEFIEIFLKEDEAACQKYIANFRKEFMAHENLTDLAFPAPMRKLKQHIDMNDPSWTIKNTRANVQGAIVYNEMLKRKDLLKSHETIKEDSRGFFIYLKQPNMANNSHVISFPEYLPEELELHDRIDRNKQYEKTFYKPIESLMKPRGWTMEVQPSLSDLFG